MTSAQLIKQWIVNGVTVELVSKDEEDDANDNNDGPGCNRKGTRRFELGADGVKNDEKKDQPADSIDRHRTSCCLSNVVGAALRGRPFAAPALSSMDRGNAGRGGHEVPPLQLGLDFLIFRRRLNQRGAGNPVAFVNLNQPNALGAAAGLADLVSL